MSVLGGSPQTASSTEQLKLDAGSTAPGALSLPRNQWRARSGHVPSLDGIRAVSVLLVLVGHFLLPSNLVGVSALGLKTFFVLSGFLITRLLLAESYETGKIALPQFYVRRILRLYPVILVYLAVTGAVALARSERIDPYDIASVFFYFVNYRVIHYLHVGGFFTLPVGMLWSLSIEEHFYLIAPVVLVLLAGDARRMLVFALLVSAMSLALRLWYAHRFPGIVDTLEIYWRTETRVDSIAAGVILACLPQLRASETIIEWLTRRGVAIAGVMLLIASFALRDNYFQNTWRFSIQSLALMPIIASVVFAQPFVSVNQILNTRLLTWIGALSYSLYVWHGAIDFFFRPYLERLPPVAQPISHLVLAFIIASLSFYVVERPVMQWRRRLGKSRVYAAQAVPPIAT